MSLDGLEKGRDYNLKAALTFAESTACPEKWWGRKWEGNWAMLSRSNSQMKGGERADKKSCSPSAQTTLLFLGRDETFISTPVLRHAQSFCYFLFQRHSRRDSCFVARAEGFYYFLRPLNPVWVMGHSRIIIVWVCATRNKEFPPRCLFWIFLSWDFPASILF